MSDIPKCMLCDSNSFTDMPYFYQYQARRIQIIRCASCGLSMLHPMLSADEVVLLYRPEYFEKDYHCGTSARMYVEEVEAMQRDFRPYLAMIKKFCPQGNYLEIGCAGGATLAEARQHGFDTIGVELSAHMAEWGKKNLQLDIRNGTVEQQHFFDDSFDVVYLGDVVEHLLNPKDVLAEIWRILRPGGLVALAYPMELNHIVPRLRLLFGLRRRSLDKPYHLFYYTTITMQKLLAHCGFEAIIEKVDKIRRLHPVWTYAADSLNHALTKLTGKWGDRGFTIAYSLKEQKD